MQQQCDEYNENFSRRISVDIDFTPLATTINKCLHSTKQWHSAQTLQLTTKLSIQSASPTLTINKATTESEWELANKKINERSMALGGKL